MNNAFFVSAPAICGHLNGKSESDCLSRLLANLFSLRLEPIPESAPDRELGLAVGPQSGVSFSNRRRAPSGDLVRAPANLAAHLIYRLWEGKLEGTCTLDGGFSTIKDEMLKVVDIMLEVVETCLSTARESGTLHAGKTDLLCAILEPACCLGCGKCKAHVAETMQLVSAGVSIGESMGDSPSRLQTLVLSPIRLLEGVGETDTPYTGSGQGSVRSRGSTSVECTVALEWDVGRSSIKQGCCDASPIPELCRVASEVLCATLADGWRADQKADVREVAIPLGHIMVALAVAGTSGERQIAALSLGRLFVLVGGDPDMARLLLPLLADGILGSDNSTPTPVYACLLHVLATVGGVSGQCGFPLALNQVLE